MQQVVTELPSAEANRNLKLEQVPFEALRQVWPLVVHKIAEVVQRTHGNWTIDGIAERLVKGEWQLWVVHDGAVRAVLATELFHEMSGRLCARIVFCTGNGAKHWVHLLSDVEEWARDNGAQRLEMLARKGWKFHLDDYKCSHVLLEKDLAGTA